MKLYRFDIVLESAFATIPKGDTIFGQFCWQIVQNMGSNELDRLLETYQQAPFAIISDLLPANSIRKPPIADSLFGISFDPKKRKILKAKNMIDLDEFEQHAFRYNKRFIIDKIKSNEPYKIHETIVVRNAIDRLTSTTDTGFDPFANYRYDHGMPKATFYLMLDDRLPIEDARRYLEQIGKTGLGKDATIGRGRYRIKSVREYRFDNPDANAMMTLSPSVLHGQGFKKVWYDTFTRFGKHGNHLAHALVWKNPILMADSFALIYSDPKPYIGQGLGGDGSISKAMTQTVHQGYAITIPITLEVDNETVPA